MIKLGNALELGWQLAGLKKPIQHADWTKATRARLPFREFQVGSRFFLKHTPIYMAIKEKTLTTEPSTTTPKAKAKGKKETISKALQHRWTGPYKVTAKFSPVLYETIINGTPRVVHALHMKHDPIGEALRLKQPLAVSETTPMKSYQTQEHISLQLRPIQEQIDNDPRELEQQAIKARVQFEQEESDSDNNDSSDSEQELEDDEDDYRL